MPVTLLDSLEQRLWTLRSEMELQATTMTSFCTATILLGIQLSAPPEAHWKLRESTVETYGGFLWRSGRKCILKQCFLWCEESQEDFDPFIPASSSYHYQTTLPVGLWTSLNLLLKLIPAVLKTRQIWHPSGTGRWKCNFRAILHCQIPVASGMQQNKTCQDSIAAKSHPIIPLRSFKIL